MLPAGKILSKYCAKPHYQDTSVEVVIFHTVLPCLYFALNSNISFTLSSKLPHRCTISTLQPSWPHLIYPSPQAQHDVQQLYRVVLSWDTIELRWHVVSNGNQPSRLITTLVLMRKPDYCRTHKVRCCMMPDERTCSKCAKLGRACVVVAVNNMPKLDLEKRTRGLRDHTPRKRPVATNVVKSRSLQISQSKDAFDRQRSVVHTSSTLNTYASTLSLKASLLDPTIRTDFTWYKPNATSEATRDGIQVCNHQLEPSMSTGWKYSFEDIAIPPSNSDTAWLDSVVGPGQLWVEQWPDRPLQATSNDFQKCWDPVKSTCAFNSVAPYAWPAP